MPSRLRCAAVLLTLLGAACAAPAPAPRQGDDAQPKPGGSISIVLGQEPFNFDLTLVGRSGGNSQSAHVAYETLLGFKNGPGVDYHQMIAEPLLAERWEVSPDARSYTFHLRRGVRFANLSPVNGRELTSQDVKFSYEYSSRTGEFSPGARQASPLPAAQFAFYFEGLDRVEGPDPYTVVVSFKQPFVPFLAYAAAYHNPIMPREIFDQDGDFKARIVGSGPFQWDQASTQTGTRWVWKKNPDYWQTGRPYIDEQRWVILTDPATWPPAFRTRQVELLHYTNLSPREVQLFKQQNPSAVVSEYLAGGGSGNIYWNVRRPPLNDVRVRKAIMLGLDRDELIRTLASGRGKWALAGAFDDIYTEEEVKQILRYDPTEAKRLLTEAGFPGGLDIEWMFPARGSSLDYVPMSELIQSQLKKVGVNLRLAPVDFQDWLLRTRVGVSNFEMVPRGQAVKDDVDSYLYASFHSRSARNYSGVNDPALDKMLEAQRAELDPGQRKELIRQAVRHVADNAWGLRSYADMGYQFWQPYLKDYYPHNGRDYWDLTRSWLDK